MKHVFLKKICILLCLSLLLLPVLSGCGEVREISEVDINKKGELIISWSDGEEDNLGVVVGKDGQDGSDGNDGQDGEDGKDGENGETISGTDQLITATGRGLRSAVSVACGFFEKGSYRRPSSSPDYYSFGSGVIYQYDEATGEAFIITNYHVVFDVDSSPQISDDIHVYLYGQEVQGQEIPAEYVGGSMNYDIAVLHVKPNERMLASDVAAVTVADSNELAVGSTAIAVGNPEGLGLSASYGIVSVDSEYIDMTAADESTTVSFRVMRVDTAVNSGNSGGGLYNQSGELIGIVNAKIMSSDVENIGYAIPSALACAVADNIIDYCYQKDCKTVQRCLLGVTVTTQDSRMVYDSALGTVRIVDTVVIYEVSNGGLAEGRLQSDDILVSITIAGKTMHITRQFHVVDAMLRARVGDTVVISVLRNGQAMDLTFTMTEEHLYAY